MADTHNNTNEHEELSYWAKKLDVTLEEMLDAIEKVGTNIDEVAHALGKSWEKQHLRR
jgi:hypothetical protein